MLKNLKLRQKFTVFLSLILLVGLSLSGVALSAVLRENAKNDIANTAQMMMETMTSVRAYTDTQVNPQLVDKLDTEFLPQSVPAYSAREVFEILRKNPDYRDFFYKEATLNPTNLRDKVDSFEEKLVNRFRNEKDLKELRGFRSMSGGDVFYIARPLAIQKQSCLQCHSTVEAAPKSMIDRYGTENGFGWQLNEIVSAKIVSVPASKVLEKAYHSSFLVIGIVSLLFIIIIALVNILLNRHVIRPLKRLTAVAEEISMGHVDAEFGKLPNDEIGTLGKAFKRMQLSLAMAMKRLSRSQGEKSNA
ncbi:MAG TPA: DUF3365 domain-containing protein [Trichocoleus sp.]|jgi:HAMP domain-containing protein